MEVLKNYQIPSSYVIITMLHGVMYQFHLRLQMSAIWRKNCTCPSKRHEAYWGRGRKIPIIRNLGTRGRQVGGLTPQSPYLKWNGPDIPGWIPERVYTFWKRL